MIIHNILKVFQVKQHKLNHLRYFCNKDFLEMNLQAVIKKLEEFAPLKNAESWDNVGLLIEPATPKKIKTIFLTNDLTEPVLKEALEKNSDLIISYHPPIFAPIKRIRQMCWKERIISICLENRIAVYSPHTAWDVANGGVNDWLASAFKSKQILPIKPLSIDNPDEGIGRVLSLIGPIKLKEAVEMVKKQIGISTVHLAIGNNSNLETAIRSIAICAGSGASLLKDVQADLYLTGEMSHHELLDATQRDISVILCNHSNSERGFLKEFKNLLSCILENECDIFVSEKDADPLSSY